MNKLRELEFNDFEELADYVRSMVPIKNIVGIRRYPETGLFVLYFWFYNGGIVQGATAALVGEAGPEIVFPLDKLNDFIKFK